MMNKERIIQGYVIKSVDYGENDAIITVLTKNSLEVFKAKGVLKLTSKNRSSCLMYAKSEFTLEEGKSHNQVLTKGTLLSSNFKLYDSLDYMTCLGLISESIMTFLGNDVSIEIYDVFEGMIDCINNGFDIFTLTCISLANIIKRSGYILELKECVRCSKKDKIVFLSYNDGGFVCSRCLNNFEDFQSVNYLQTVRYVFMVDKDNYYHYQIEHSTSIRLINEFIYYLQNKYDYTKLVFFDLFHHTY